MSAGVAVACAAGAALLAWLTFECCWGHYRRECRRLKERLDEAEGRELLVSCSPLRQGHGGQVARLRLPAGQQEARGVSRFRERSPPGGRPEGLARGCSRGRARERPWGKGLRGQRWRWCWC